MRIYDPRLARFLSVDPLTGEYPWYTPYQFAGNTPIQAIDLDGLEPWFILAEPPPVMRPVIEVITENGIKAGAEVTKMGMETSVEVSAPKGSPRFTPEQFQNLRRGVQTEEEQLIKNGLEKNTQKFNEKVDGKDVSTILDAVRPNGGTVEIKDVKTQSLTRQLKAQIQKSQKSGAQAELMINKTAKLSGPLQKADIKITPYSILPSSPSTLPRDNTNIPKVDPMKKLTFPVPKPRPVDPKEMA